MSNNSNKNIFKGKISFNKNSSNNYLNNLNYISSGINNANNQKISSIVSYDNNDSFTNKDLINNKKTTNNFYSINNTNKNRTINVNYCNKSNAYKQSNFKGIYNCNNSNHSSVGKDPIINKYIKTGISKVGKVQLKKNVTNSGSSFSSIYIKNSISVSPSTNKPYSSSLKYTIEKKNNYNNLESNLYGNAIPNLNKNLDFNDVKKNKNIIKFYKKVLSNNNNNDICLKNSNYSSNYNNTIFCEKKKNSIFNMAVENQKISNKNKGIFNKVSQLSNTTINKISNKDFNKKINDENINTQENTANSRNEKGLCMNNKIKYESLDKNNCQIEINKQNISLFNSVESLKKNNLINNKINNLNKKSLNNKYFKDYDSNINFQKPENKIIFNNYSNKTLNNLKDKMIIKQSKYTFSIENILKYNNSSCLKYLKLIKIFKMWKNFIQNKTFAINRHNLAGKLFLIKFLQSNSSITLSNNNKIVIVDSFLSIVNSNLSNKENITKGLECLKINANLFSIDSIIIYINMFKEIVINILKEEIQEINNFVYLLKISNKNTLDNLLKIYNYFNASLKKYKNNSTNINIFKNSQVNLNSCANLFSKIQNNYNNCIKIIHYISLCSFFNKTLELSLTLQQMLLKKIIYPIEFYINNNDENKKDDNNAYLLKFSNIENSNISLLQNPTSNDLTKKLEDFLQIFLNNLFLKNGCYYALREILENNNNYLNYKISNLTNTKYNYYKHENIFSFYKANVINILKNKTLKTIKNLLDFENKITNNLKTNESCNINKSNYNNFVVYFIKELNNLVNFTNCKFEIKSGNNFYLIVEKINYLYDSYLHLSKLFIKINLDTQDKLFNKLYIDNLAFNKIIYDYKHVILYENIFAIHFKEFEPKFKNIINSKIENLIVILKDKLLYVLDINNNMNSFLLKFNNNKFDNIELYDFYFKSEEIIDSVKSYIIDIEYIILFFKNSKQEKLFSYYIKNNSNNYKLLEDVMSKFKNFDCFKDSYDKIIKINDSLRINIVENLNTNVLDNYINEAFNYLIDLKNISDLRDISLNIKKLQFIENKIFLIIKFYNYLNKTNLIIEDIESLNIDNSNFTSIKNIVIEFKNQKNNVLSISNNNINIENICIITKNIFVNYKYFTNNNKLLDQISLIYNNLKDINDVKYDMLKKNDNINNVKTINIFKKLVNMIFIENINYLDNLHIKKTYNISLEDIFLNNMDLLRSSNINNIELFIYKFIYNEFNNILTSLESGINDKNYEVYIIKNLNLSIDKFSKKLNKISIYLSSNLNNKYYYDFLINNQIYIENKKIINIATKFLHLLSNFIELIKEYILNKDLILLIINSPYIKKSVKDQESVFNINISLDLVLTYIMILNRLFESQIYLISNTDILKEKNSLFNSVSVLFNNFNESIEVFNKELILLISMKNDFFKRIKEKYPKLLILDSRPTSDILNDFIVWNFKVIKKCKSVNIENNFNMTNFESYKLNKEDIINLNYYYFKMNNVYLTILSKKFNNSSNENQSDILYYIKGLHVSKHKFIVFQNKLELNKIITSSVSSDILSIYNRIDHELKFSLKCEIVNSLNNFPKHDFFNWLFLSSSQVSICNLNLIFSNEISQILVNLNSDSYNNVSESSYNSDKNNINNTSLMNRAEKLKSVSKKKSKNKGENIIIIINDLKALLYKYNVWIKILADRLNNLNDLNSKNSLNTSDKNKHSIFDSIEKNLLSINHEYSDFSTIDSNSKYILNLNNTKINESNEKNNISNYSNKIIKQDINTTINNCSEYIKSNILNLFIVLINHKCILMQLIKSNIYEIESYDWLKYVRHLWDDEKKDVIVECGGWSIYQQYNFISNTKILLTPQTEKVFLFSASCFREKSAAIIKTTFNAYSYYHIFEEFASNFWINLIKIKYEIPCNIQNIQDNYLFIKLSNNLLDDKSSINIQLNYIRDEFDNSTINKNWIFFENFDSISSNNVKIISKMMQIIQQEIILNEIKVTSANSNKFCKMFCLFGCLKIKDDYKIKESYLKSSCRIMNLTKPDISYFINNILEICGIFSEQKNDNNIESQSNNPAFITLNKVFTIILSTTEKLISSQDPNFYFDFYTLFAIQNNFFNKIYSAYNYSSLNNYCLKSFSNNNYNSKYVLVRYLAEFLIDYLRNIKYFSDEELFTSLSLSIKQNINVNLESNINYIELSNYSSKNKDFTITNMDIKSIKDEILRAFVVLGNNTVKGLLSNNTQIMTYGNTFYNLYSEADKQFISFYENNNYIINDKLIQNFNSFFINFSSDCNKVPLVYGNRLCGKSLFISSTLYAINSISNLTKLYFNKIHIPELMFIINKYNTKDSVNIINGYNILVNSLNNKLSMLNIPSNANLLDNIFDFTDANAINHDKSEYIINNVILFERIISINTDIFINIYKPLIFQYGINNSDNNLVNTFKIPHLINNMNNLKNNKFVIECNNISNLNHSDLTFYQLLNITNKNNYFTLNNNDNTSEDNYLKKLSKSYLYRINNLLKIKNLTIPDEHILLLTDFCFNINFEFYCYLYNNENLENSELVNNTLSRSINNFFNIIEVFVNYIEKKSINITNILIKIIIQSFILNNFNKYDNKIISKDINLKILNLINCNFNLLLKNSPKFDIDYNTINHILDKETIVESSIYDHYLDVNNNNFLFKNFDKISSLEKNNFNYNIMKYFIDIHYRLYLNIKNGNINYLSLNNYYTGFTINKILISGLKYFSKSKLIENYFYESNLSMLNYSQNNDDFLTNSIIYIDDLNKDYNTLQYFNSNGNSLNCINYNRKLNNTKSNNFFNCINNFVIAELNLNSNKNYEKHYDVLNQANSFSINYCDNDIKYLYKKELTYIYNNLKENLFNINYFKHFKENDICCLLKSIKNFYSLFLNKLENSIDNFINIDPLFTLSRYLAYYLNNDNIKNFKINEISTNSLLIIFYCLSFSSLLINNIEEKNTNSYNNFLNENINHETIYDNLLDIDFKLLFENVILNNKNINDNKLIVNIQSNIPKLYFDLYLSDYFVKSNKTIKLMFFNSLKEFVDNNLVIENDSKSFFINIFIFETDFLNIIIYQDDIKQKLNYLIQKNFINYKLIIFIECYKIEKFNITDSNNYNTQFNFNNLQNFLTSNSFKFINLINDMYYTSNSLLKNCIYKSLINFINNSFKYKFELLNKFIINIHNIKKLSLNEFNSFKDDNKILINGLDNNANYIYKNYLNELISQIQNLKDNFLRNFSDKDSIKLNNYVINSNQINKNNEFIDYDFAKDILLSPLLKNTNFKNQVKILNKSQLFIINSSNYVLKFITISNYVLSKKHKINLAKNILQNKIFKNNISNNITNDKFYNNDYICTEFFQSNTLKQKTDKISYYAKNLLSYGKSKLFNCLKKSIHEILNHNINYNNSSNQLLNNSSNLKYSTDLKNIIEFIDIFFFDYKYLKKSNILMEYFSTENSHKQYSICIENIIYNIIKDLNIVINKTSFFKVESLLNLSKKKLIETSFNKLIVDYNNGKTVFLSTNYNTLNSLILLSYEMYLLYKNKAYSFENYDSGFINEANNIFKTKQLNIYDVFNNKAKDSETVNNKNNDDYCTLSNNYKNILLNNVIANNIKNDSEKGMYFNDLNQVNYNYTPFNINYINKTKEDKNIINEYYNDYSSTLSSIFSICMITYDDVLIDNMLFDNYIKLNEIIEINNKLILKYFDINRNLNNSADNNFIQEKVDRKNCAINISLFYIDDFLINVKIINNICDAYEMSLSLKAYILNDYFDINFCFSNKKHKSKFNNYILTLNSKFLYSNDIIYSNNTLFKYLSIIITKKYDILSFNKYVNSIRECNFLIDNDLNFKHYLLLELLNSIYNCNEKTSSNENNVLINKCELCYYDFIKLNYTKIIDSSRKLKNNTNISSRLFKEISRILMFSFKQYRTIINQKEIINSELYFLKEINTLYNKESSEEKTGKFKTDYYINNILEKIYLGINNKFLFSIFLTLQIMKDLNEIVEEELNFVIYLLTINFNIKEDASIKVKHNFHENASEANYENINLVYANATHTNKHKLNKNSFNNFVYNKKIFSNCNLTGNAINHIDNNKNNTKLASYALAKNEDNLTVSSNTRIELDNRLTQVKLLVNIYKSKTLSLDDSLLINQEFSELILSIINDDNKNNNKDNRREPNEITCNKISFPSKINIKDIKDNKNNYQTENIVVVPKLKNTSALNYTINNNEIFSYSDNNQLSSIINKENNTISATSYNNYSKLLNIFKKQLKKDSHKLLFSLIFLKDESLSFFKYLINKYLKPIHSIDQYKINNLLKKKISCPISIKSDNSINVTNFLCSLAAYYEIEFFILRDANFSPIGNKTNLMYDYNYIIDTNIYNFINESIIKGHWLLLTCDLKFDEFCKILELIIFKQDKIHNNFKIFIDTNIINNIVINNESNQILEGEYKEYKAMIENFTLVLQIDLGSVDDLEAAHDVWVNVLEENILNSKDMITKYFK